MIPLLIFSNIYFLILLPGSGSTLLTSYMQNKKTFSTSKKVDSCKAQKEPPHLFSFGTVQLRACVPATLDKALIRQYLLTRSCLSTFQGSGIFQPGASPNWGKTVLSSYLIVYTFKTVCQVSLKTSIKDFLNI